MRCSLLLLLVCEALALQQSNVRCKGFSERMALKRVAGAALCSLALMNPMSPLMEQPAYAARPQNAASSAGSRVNKDAESLLRNGLPIPESAGESAARKLQYAIEAIKDDLRAKRISAASGDVSTAKRLVASSKEALLKAAPTSERKAEIAERLDLIKEELEPIGAALSTLGGNGSPQEREALDLAGERQAKAAKYITEIENRLVPVNYKPNIEVADEFPDVPPLIGRARVQFTLKKGPDAVAEGHSKFDIDGELFDRAVVEVVVDGYTTPLTSGNFLDLVKRKFYDGMAIQRSDGFVIQTGDPDGEEGPLVGFSPDNGKTVRRVPLEVSLASDKKNPIYGQTTEDIGKGAQAVTLPFQAYGALGMARDEYTADSASSQFFFLLFDSDLTPAGKNFLDGRYSSFGYTVKGDTFLNDLQVGDVIEKVTILKAPPPFGTYDGLDV